MHIEERKITVREVTEGYSETSFALKLIAKNAQLRKAILMMPRKA